MCCLTFFHANGVRPSWCSIIKLIKLLEDKVVQLENDLHLCN